MAQNVACLNYLLAPNVYKNPSEQRILKTFPVYPCVAQTVRFRVHSRCACKCGSRCAFPELRAFLGKPEKRKSTRAHVDQENSVQKRER